MMSHEDVDQRVRPGAVPREHEGEGVTAAVDTGGEEGLLPPRCSLA